MKTFERTVTTNKAFEDTVSATERKAGEKGFRVLHTQDVMLDHDNDWASGRYYL